jgi:hypothetical protein
MKKNILISCTIITTIGLMAFGYSNSTEDKPKNSPNINPVSLKNDFQNLFSKLVKTEDFFYAIGTRFNATVSMEDLLNANSVSDIIPKEADWAQYPIQTMRVSFGNDENETTAIGYDLLLNEQQKNLLRTLQYSDDFHFSASCKAKDGTRTDPEFFDLVYYLTVTPEKQAVYEGGNDLLINYLKESTKQHIATIEEDKIKSGKLRFTVTKAGMVSNLMLESTSGYAEIDDKMTSLIKDLPQGWIPASNSKGEPVDQELVFSFGAIGC